MRVKVLLTFFDQLSDKTTMQKTLLALMFLFLSLSASSQNTGHPGGGLDYDDEEYKLFCANITIQSAKLETKFLKFWGKEYKQRVDFFSLLDEIIIGNALEAFNKVIPQKINLQFYCEKENETASKYDFAKRTHYKEELATLKSIANQWKSAKDHIALSTACSEELGSRYAHLDKIQTLIDLYEKSTP